MSLPKRVSLYVMAVLYIFAGFNHLWSPAMYLNIMPPGLPQPELLHVTSGLIEIVLGVFLLEPRTRVLAAWGIIALLVAVFPANVYAVEQTGWVRLPFQALFIVWAWWYTRPDAEESA